MTQPQCRARWCSEYDAVGLLDLLGRLRGNAGCGSQGDAIWAVIRSRLVVGTIKLAKCELTSIGGPPYTPRTGGALGTWHLDKPFRLGFVRSWPRVDAETHVLKL